MVSNLAYASTCRHPRILAYHGVDDEHLFAAQIQHLRDKCTILNGADVADWIAGRRDLPRPAVWITFDDGRASVIERGLPILARYGATATLFVCPGLVETRTGLWSDAIGDAFRGGWRPAELPPDLDAAIDRLKALPDARRRAIVAEAALATPPRNGVEELADRGQLERWLAAGQELGNHSWDHPCLDSCDDEGQRDQVQRADEWLVRFTSDNGRPYRRLFAYPNGNRGAAAETELRRLGYEVGLLFDHRLTTDRTDPLRISRLCPDSITGLARFRAMVSGAQPTLLRVARAQRS
jgi:peptidoglycan/xylan/chitin deacetylase (PgdA/CDA1 family)